MSDDSALRGAWVRWVGDSVAARAAFDDVVARHREAHRRYHGLRHVTSVVRHAHELADEVAVRDLGAVVAAAFFHDAVYVPAARDNEEQSALLAALVLAGLGWSDERCDVVASMVRATAGHAPTDDPDRGVLLDADLSVLGSDPAAYQAYVAGVRAEYAHVDDEAWRAGRGDVLRDLLATTPIYSTIAGRSRWESRARANLTTELASLQ